MTDTKGLHEDLSRRADAPKVGSERAIMAIVLAFGILTSFGVSLFVVAFVAVGAAPTLAVLGVGVVVYGLGEGMAIPTVQDLVAGASPAASRGAVVAVWVGAARLGQTVGPLLTGVLLGVLDPQSVFFVGAGLAAALLGAQLVIRIRAPLPAASPPGPS